MDTVISAWEIRPFDQIITPTGVKVVGATSRVSDTISLHIDGVRCWVPAEQNLVAKAVLNDSRALLLAWQ